MTVDAIYIFLCQNLQVNSKPNLSAFFIACMYKLRENNLTLQLFFMVIKADHSHQTTRQIPIHAYPIKVIISFSIIFLNFNLTLYDLILNSLFDNQNTFLSFIFNYGEKNYNKKISQDWAFLWYKILDTNTKIKSWNFSSWILDLFFFILIFCLKCSTH